MLGNLTNKKAITPPKHLNASSIPNFLNECEKIFSFRKKRKENYILDLSKVKKSSLLGVLIIYKIVEYSVNNECFEGPLLWLEPHSEVGVSIETYGFTNLLHSYILNRNETEKEYKKLRVSVSRDFIIAPQALIRTDKKNREEINKKYLPEIDKYYRNNPKAVSMIFLVFSEILLNFWEHAVEDTKSIIVAYGNSQRIEIACADTGNGIISTLRPILNNQDYTPEQVILKALEKGVTSKKLTNHMGYGLWILDQIAGINKGQMQIYSQGAYYVNENNIKRHGKCGYWQGTIVYISLNLNKPKTLEDVESESLTKNILINWG